ncbi:SpaA isopeptide-forming pilin-related protein [Secundilactobacillus hailunensis]|uniref:SpaA isopeptide-forming pilin-related protein n=1 Tax=Secundilactobacillus hailunensis TaxID=2559923 RepID=A0ABW1T7S8_9LACO|nr:LPXTG cell wall anchor domain-containing protein [Secundilactobacillus hailunensis]
MKNGDFYTFKIYGLKEFNGTNTGSLGYQGEEFATWKLTEGSDSKGKYQEIRIEFTNEKMNATNVRYALSLKQEYSGSGPIDFEYNGESTWTVDPTETKSMLTKSGKFIENRQIEWTIDLANDSEDMKFNDLVLEDFINTQGTNHSFVKGSWKAVDTDTNEDVTNKFEESYSSDGNQLTLKGNDGSKVGENIQFTIITSYDRSSNGSFWNEVGGQIGENINIEKVNAHVENTKLSKTATNYNPETGIYSWQANIDFNLSQFGNDDQAIEAIQNMVITDTLAGSHEFATDPKLKVMIGDKDVTDSFAIDDEASGKTKLVIKPIEDAAKNLHTLLKDNANKPITLTYDTKETAGQVGSAENNIGLELEGKTSHFGASGNSGGLVVKDGNLSRKVHEDGKAHINWEITANEGNRAFTTLNVVDVLPENIEYTDVKNIKINGANLSAAGVTMSEGTVNNFTKDGPYDFSPDKNETGRKALQFVFDSNFSGEKIEITFETVHNWGSNSHTNYVGATTEDGRYQYGNKVVTIPDNIRDGSAKSGELHLDQEKGAKGNNYVTWKVNFGSHLNHYFGNGDKQTNKVTITDTLNADGAQYLKFIDSGYKLYALDNRGNERDPAVVPEDDYKLTWETVNDNQRLFTIEFKDGANDKGYTNFRLEFNTPIDINAWQKGDEEASSIPGIYYFWNKAQVSYDDIELDEVGNHVSLSSRGIYGQKTGKSDGTNMIAWEVLMNAYSEDIGYPEITDELSAGQMHSVNDIELAFVTPKFTANGDGFNVEVVPGSREIKLVKGEDYEVHHDSNSKMTIKLTTKVDQPLVIRYKSIMEEQHALYSNTAKISAGSHSTEYMGRHTLTGSALMNSWGLRFRKVDGDTGKALSGATFQLQQKVGHGDWEAAKRMDNDQPYEPVVSNSEGYIEYLLMGTRAKYRIVEISPPANYSGQMGPLEFDKKSAEEAGWTKEAHEIKNYTTIPGNLTISKASENLKENSFNFEVRAVDEDGNVNTQLQGTYKLQEGGEVTFHNGVSEEISVPANKERTILGLPTEKIDDKEKKTTQYYDVRETSTSDDYTTQIAVNNDDPIWDKQTQPFRLSTSTATPVTIFFTNTPAKGPLVVSKTVSSEVEDELKAPYKFTVEADQKDKVAGKTYKAEGAGLEDLEFDKDGKTTFELTNTQQVKINGLPEGVKFTVTEEATGMETTWSINGGNYTNDTDENSVIINSDKVQNMDFKNSSTKTGQLRITKQIEGNIPANAEFKFEIKADPQVDGEYPYATYAGSEQQPDTSGRVKFENGTATLTLKGGEYVRINNLPLGEKFAVREIDPDDKDIQTTWQIGSSTGDDRQADPITLKNADELVNVRFTNKLPNGSLTLNKEVLNRLPGDQSIRFDFTIQADKDDIDKVAGKTFTVEDNRSQRENITFNDDGQASLQLRHDQSVKVLGLPVGTHLKISEEKHSDFDMSYEVVGDEDADDEDSDGPTVTVPDDKNVSVNYTNDRSTGNLLLEKHAEGSYPTNKDIEFTIEALDKDGNTADLTDEFDATLTRANGSTTTQEVNFENGKVDVSIKPGERLEVKNLPNGDYKVTEEGQDKSVTTTWKVGNDSDTGLVANATVKKGGTTHVEFTNKIDDGDLMLEKKAEGKYPTDKDIGFTITALDDNEDLTGNYQATLTHTDGTPVQRNVKFEDGKADVAIKPGERLLVKNLPTGKYQVSEDKQDENVITTWDIGSAQGPREDENPVDADPVEVKENDTAHVRFVNDIPVGSLELNKKVLSPQSGDLTTEFTFTIQADDNDVSKVANNTYDVDANFNGRDNVKFNNDGQATLTLSHNQSVKILGLPTGVHLRISEEQHSDFNVSYTINGDKDDDEDGPAVTVPDGKNVAVNYTNTRPDYGSLVLEKRAEGDYPKNENVGFTINKNIDKADDVEVDEDFSGKFKATLTHVDGMTVDREVEFENGTTHATIKPGEKLQINGLPAGQFQVIEDNQDDSVTTTWDTGSAQGTDEEANPVDVKENDTAHVLFVNNIATGSLELNKSVASHDNADKDKEFEFKIQEIGKDSEDDEDGKSQVASKSYDISGLPNTKRIEFNKDGIATLKLKHDQAVTISGLPEGVKFKVTETVLDDLEASWNVNNDGEYNQLTGDNYPEVTITEGKTEVVSYRNTRDKVGSLRVDKIVKGAYTDDNREFEFKVNAEKLVKKVNEDPDGENNTTEEWVSNTDLNGKKYDVKIYSRDKNELLANSDVEFTNGAAKLKLKADQYAVIDGLPLKGVEKEDLRFQVSEEDPEVANMSTTWAVNNSAPEAGLVAGPVTLDENKLPRVTFTNSLETGNLVLEKKLSGELTDADRNKTFNFTVDAQIEDTDNPGEWQTDEDFAGTYTATKTPGMTTSNVTFTKGQLNVSLKGGERLQISNLPANMRMVVNETPDTDYETSHQIDHGSVNPGTTTDQITIPNGADVAVSFINDRPAQPQTAWLSLTKSVLGENGERDRRFEFNIRFLDDEMNPLTGTVDFVKTSQVGGYTPGQMMLDVDGNGTLTLMDGETIRWNVPNGTHYQVTESDYSADGYQTSISQGQAPEREGLTATGVVMTNDPANAKVVYYNNSITPPEEEPHDGDDDTDTTPPDFVPPAPEDAHTSGTTNGTTGGASSGTLPGSTTGSSTQGTTGSQTTPQAHISDTGSKGILPQTGEWLMNHWLIVLGLVLLATAVGLMFKVKRKKG